MKQQDIFASSQIITFNPILNESVDLQTQYFMYLKELIRFIGWDKRKYTKAQIEFYKNKLCIVKKIPKSNIIEYSFDSQFCYLLPYDLTIMLGFHPKAISSDKTKKIVNKIGIDFSLPKGHLEFLLKGFKAAMGDQIAWEEIIRNPEMHKFKPYLILVKKILIFLK